MSPSELLDRLSENYNSDRKLSRENSVMIPAHALFFLYPDCSRRVGISPHPQQEEFFPEHVVTFPPAIAQPFEEKDEYTPPADRVTSSIKGGTGRVAQAALAKIPVLGRGIEVRESRIVGGGRGLYATRGFEMNEVITLYIGHIFGERQRLHMQAAGLGTHCKPLQVKHSYLDGVKEAFTGMSAAQLVNQGCKSTVNCDWTYLDISPGTGQRVIGIRATRKIFPGEELYINYGIKFWSERDYEPTPPPEVILPEDEKILKIETALADLKTVESALFALAKQTESIRQALESMLPVSRAKRKR